MTRKSAIESNLDVFIKKYDALKASHKELVEALEKMIIRFPVPSAIKGSMGALYEANAIQQGRQALKTAKNI